MDNVESTIPPSEQHDDVNDQQLGGGLGIPNYDDQEEHYLSHDENIDDAPESPQVQLKRSFKKRQPSTRYSSNEYIKLTSGGELECFEEALESEEKQQWLDAM